MDSLDCSSCVEWIIDSGLSLGMGMALFYGPGSMVIFFNDILLLHFSDIGDSLRPASTIHRVR